MKTKIYSYIRETLGIAEQEILDDLWQEYRAAFRENLNRITALLPSRDGQNLARAAHSLKGCAGNIGHSSVYELCLKLENAGKDADFASAERLLEQLQEAFASLEE